MKSRLQTNKKGRAGALSVRSAVCLFTALAAVVVIALAWWSRAYAADIPAGYALDASTILNLAVNHSYEGITRNGEKEFGIAGAQGFVTLARVSQSDSLAGYTFKISAREILKLEVRSGNGEENLKNSFYGIGSDSFPFKGSIVMTEVTASTYLNMSGWNVLFNNLSNEASITTQNADIGLWADFNAPFALCDTLTITKDSPLDISAFRFAAREVQSDGGVKGVVQGNETAGLVAGKVAGTGTCAVDLSPCFKDGAQYALETAGGSAGGLFGMIEKDASVSVTTGNLNILVSSADAGNVGLLVGENKGTFTVSSESTYTGSATAADDAAAGLIGVNANTGTVNFAESVTVNAFTATGAYAGGVAGKSDGEITAAAGKTCTVSDSTFTSAATLPMLGGAVGQATAAPVGSFTLSGNTFAKSGNVGGFIGSFTAKDAAKFTDVFVETSTFSGTGGAATHSVGGYFGLLNGQGAITITSDKASAFTFNSLVAGSYGGVIGTVAAGSVVTVGGGMTVTNTFASGGFSGSLGGAVGCVEQGAYCKLDNLTLNNTMNAALQAGVGDLVGQAAAKALVDVGSITYTNNGQASVLVSATGVGTVLRLAGVIMDSSASSGHIVRTQTNSLLYADTGYTFTRTGNLTSNDVGNYGQILRNDKLHILNFDAASHTVSVQNPLTSSTNITLSSAADAAKLALTLHTHGAVSGVNGITGNQYNKLLSATITLTGDIDLQGSGVEQITPANEREVFFKGKILGNGNILTLAIGESSRTKEGEDANVGILNDGVNMRYFMGAFSGLSGATVEKVTVAGDLKHYADAPIGFFFGGLAGYAKHTSITIKDCTSNVNITLAEGTTKASIYVGGFLGSIQENTVVSITGSTTNAAINLRSGYGIQAVYLGGVVGRVTIKTNKEVAFTNNTISASITQNVNATNAHVGGCFGDLVCNNYISVDMTGTKAVNASVTSASSASAGGLIGHTVQRCKLVLDGAWQGTVSSGNASVGGLIYDLDGKLTVNSGFSVNDSTFTSNNATKGILVAEGTQAFVVVNCDPSGFQTVKADGFDLFVGKNIASRASMGVAATGGLVTVETGASIGQIPENSGWYSMISARQNSNTRYYFNIARLDQAVTKYEPSTTAKTPADVIYWHVYDYVQGALPDYVRGESFPTAITDITGAGADIDMTNYSFYPTKKEGVTFDFSGKKLTFGYTVAGLPRTGQMFGIQSGILSDVIATNESVTASLTNITLAGTVYPVNGSSGAFICGKVVGNRTATVTADANFKVEKVFFEGLTVDGAATPLLIDTIGSNVTGALTSVSQYTQESYEKISKHNTYADGTPAASALIGKGGIANENGSTASSNISVTFKNIVFAAEEGKSIFTKASYFEAINCVNGTGAYIYNFNLAEDWDGGHKNAVTYGTEISTNPKQYEYYDQEILVDPTSGNHTGGQNTAFSTGYRPYVYTTMDGGTSLRVNRKSVNFDRGWGTYENPYIIERAAQLEELTKLVSMSSAYSFSQDWVINYPKASGTALDYTGCDVYTASTSGTLKSGAMTLKAETLREYLRGAYYKISAPMELSREFTGIGTEQYPFHGVIAGTENRTVITLPSNTNVGNTGYCGFINVANGCAVYGLELSYENVGLSGSVFGANKTTSTIDSTTAASTGTTHFGGVIGWIVGGDNLIDSVSVKVEKLQAGHITSVYGGYVGLISGGGVSLRELGEAPTDMASYEGYYYYNPYVGKVISGYAISSDLVYENTAKNFSIPVITNDRLTRGCKTEWESTGLYKITVADTDDLLMLGFAMNGGALEYVSNYLGYGQGALSRHGDYHAVGETNPTAVSIIKGRYEDDLSGGGKSLFLSYFGISTASDMREREFSLELTAAEYDLSKYPNAFRGLGSPFGGTNCYNIQKITGLKNEQGRAGTVIKLYTDIKQYYKAQNAYEPDAFKNLALVEERNNSNNTITFSDIKLTGKMALGFVDLSGNEVTDKVSNTAFCVGGYMGYARNTYFDTAEIENLTVRSPGWAAGFVASEEYDWKAQSIPYVVNHCHVTGLDAKGVLSTGGLFAYLRVHANDAAKFNDVYVENSVIQVMNTSGGGFNYSNNCIYAGGIVGAALNNYSLSMTGVSISKTAVLCTSSKRYYGIGNFDAGGFMGRAETSLYFKDCTLDGSVVFSGTALDNKTAPTEYALSTADIRNAVYEKIKNAAAYAMNTRYNGNDSDGNAGGFAGIAFSKVSIENSAIRSDEASTVILGYNNGGGVVGEGKSGANYSFTGLSVQATNHPLYIMGRSCSAGLIPWHVQGDSANAVVAKGVRVSGGASVPVYILATKNSSGDVFASGLLGHVNQISVDVTDAEVSNCIIAGSRAAGVLRGFDGASTSLQNIKVFGNYIQSTNSSLAGIFNTVGKPVSLDGLYFADNMLRSGNRGKISAGGIVDTIGNNGILNGCNILMKDNDMAFTGSAKSIADILKMETTKPSDVTGTDYERVGLIGYENKGMANILALSVEEDDNVAKQKRFRFESSSSSTTVIFAGYGAPSVFETEYFTKGNKEYTPADALRDHGVTPVTTDKLNGDAVTTTQGSATPNYLNANLEKWGAWKDKSVKLTDTGIKPLSALTADKLSITQNRDLSVLSINGATQQTMSSFLNLLTGGGFGTMGSAYTLTVQADRYTLGNDGTLTLQAAGQGSVLYDGQKFTAGKYDDLESENKSLTVLTLTFRSSAVPTQTYSMNVVVYYPQILEYKSYISVLEGEVYQLSSFLTAPKTSIDVSAGSKYSLYVEYAYNDTAKKIENFNFDKRIDSGTPDGSSGGTKNAFTAGTKFVLVDLNSPGAYGYKSYYYTADKDTYTLDFSRFQSETDTPFTVKLLPEVVQNLLVNKDHLCKDANYGHVERYLLVVIPQTAEQLMQYTLRATVAENDRNIIVRDHKEKCSVNVWGKATGEMDLTTPATTFSNVVGKELVVNAHVQVNFPSNYISAMQGRDIYGTHVFKIMDASNKAVSLPAGTKALLTDKDGKTLLATRVTTATSTVRYELDNIVSLAPGDSLTDDFVLTLDFSEVSPADFSRVFADGGAYMLQDEFYISSDRAHYTNGSKIEGSTISFTAKTAVPVKLTVIPVDRKSQAINMGGVKDSTDSGEILFDLVADFSAVPEKDRENIKSAKVEFFLYQKQYDAASGKHVYSGDNLLGTLGTVGTDGKTVLPLTTDWKATGQYTLSVNLDYVLAQMKTDYQSILSNYRLMAKVTGLDANGTPVAYSAESYFVFLLCDIDNQIGA